MNRLRLYLLALTALIVCSAKADEGMWLLQLMQQQHSIDMMKKQGLKLEPGDYEFLTLQQEIESGATLEQMERCSRYLRRRMYGGNYLT